MNANNNNFTCSINLKWDHEYTSYRISLYVVESNINFYYKDSRFLIDSQKIIENYKQKKVVDREVNDSYSVQIETFNLRNNDEFLLFYQSEFILILN